MSKFFIVVPFNLLAAACLASYFGELNLLFELASHFRVQFCILFFFFTLIFIAGRKKIESTVSILFLIGNIALVYPYYQNSTTKIDGADSSSQLKILQLNCQGGLNSRFDRTIKLVNETKPDIVGLSEITPSWQTALDKGMQDFPHRIVEPHLGGIAIYSKLPLKDAQIKYTGKIKRPRITARIIKNNQDTLVVLAHPVIPILYGNLRNEELAIISNEIKNYNGPAILFGDLNCTPFSHYFQKLLKETNLHDTELGFGIVPTWSARWFIKLFPIDHCLVSKQFETIDRKTYGSVGSDHYPVLVKLRVK